MSTNIKQFYYYLERKRVSTQFDLMSGIVDQDNMASLFHKRGLDNWPGYSFDTFLVLSTA